MIHKNKIFSLFRTYSLKKVLQISGILASAFLLGSLASRFTDHFFPASSRSVTGQEIHFGTATPRTEIKNSAEFIQKTASDLFAPSAVETASLSFSIADSDPALLDTLLLPSSNWGLSFPSEGQRPTGNATIEELSACNAHYVSNTEENIRQMFNSALGDSYTIEFDWRDATE